METNRKVPIETSTFKILISAYSVYPEQKSSEAIVNCHWISALGKYITTRVISSHMTIGNDDRGFQSTFLGKLYEYSRSKKLSFSVLLLRLLNKVGRFREYHIYYRLWSYTQKKALLRNIKNNQDAVYWARILPTVSLAPLLEFYKTHPFPLIININDPIHLPSSENIYECPIHIVDQLPIEERMLIDGLKIAQCLTFPSPSLADYISTRYGFERDRCFVVPHAMPEVKSLFTANYTGSKVRIVYTGTLYKSAFSESLLSQLQQFMYTKQGTDCEFVFAFGQYDIGTLDALQIALPRAIIHKNLSREEAVKISAEADCIMVTDGPNHSRLLKGKLVEAFSLGVPIIAFTYQDSLTASLVHRYGGVVSYHDKLDSIFTSLLTLVSNLKDKSWRENFIAGRGELMEAFSEERIVKSSVEIANYAYTRYKLESLGRNTSVITKPQCANFI